MNFRQGSMKEISDDPVPAREAGTFIPIKYVLVSHFEDEGDLNRRVQRQDIYADGGPRMSSRLPEDREH